MSVMQKLSEHSIFAFLQRLMEECCADLCKLWALLNDNEEMFDKLPIGDLGASFSKHWGAFKD